MKSKFFQPKFSITRVTKANKDKKTPKKINSYLILFRISYKGEEIKISSKLNASPNNWNAKEKKFKGIDSNNLNIELDSRQSTLRDSISKIINKYPQLELYSVKERYNLLKDNSKQSKILRESNTLESLILAYKENLPKKNSRKNVDNLLFNIINSNAIDKSIEVEKMDRTDIQLFQSELLTKDLGVNYIERLMNTFRTILNYTTESIKPKASLVSDITSVKSQLKKDSVEIIVLTVDEFNLIRNFTTKVKSLEEIRDSFVFMCLTGQRSGDYRDKNIKNDVYENGKSYEWQLKQEKTGKEVIIPLTNEGLEILKKYNYKIPLNHKSNIHLKELCKEIGLDRQIKKVRTIGKNEVVTVCPLYEAMTLHISRKSFVTIAYHKKFRTEVIKSITGHSSLVEFDKYLDIYKDVKDELVNSL